MDCEDQGMIKHIDWNKLLNSQNLTIVEMEKPNINFTLMLNPNSLSITIMIQLEYIGNATNGVGTTYVIDFKSFSMLDRDKINFAGTCSNRISSSFDNITNFIDYWKYSTKPYLNGHIGSNTYLSYPPPSSYWSLSIENNTCSPIEYFATFSWNELKECNDYIDISNTATSISLSGTIYVNVVSPLSMSITDTGIYRIYPLVQQDFTISIIKQINVMSSTGIQLFIISVIGIFENNDGSITMTLLTQCADYIQLTDAQLLSLPISLDPSLSANIAPNSITGESCLTAASSTCGQLFQITITEHQYDHDSDNNKTCPDISGTYDVGFGIKCRSNTINNTQCQSFINNNNGSRIVLGFESNFIDNNCEAEIYSLTIDGSITFYDDIDYQKIHSENSNDYVIGIDTIYVEIEVNLPQQNGINGSLDIFNVVIDNIFVCTVNESVDLSVDIINGEIGCLSKHIDQDGYYNIIRNGIAMDYYSAMMIKSNISNIVRFSFLTFDVARTTMWVHAQLTLELNNKQNYSSINRRILLQNNQNRGNSDQIRHFVNNVNIQEPDDRGIVYITRQQNISNLSNHNLIHTIIYIGGSVFILFSLIIICIIFICHQRNTNLEKQMMDLNNQIKQSLDVPVRIQLGSFSTTQTQESRTSTINNINTVNPVNPITKVTPISETDKTTSYDPTKQIINQKSTEYNLTQQQLNDLINMVNQIEFGIDSNIPSVNIEDRKEQKEQKEQTADNIFHLDLNHLDLNKLDIPYQRSTEL